MDAQAQSSVLRRLLDLDASVQAPIVLSVVGVIVEVKFMRLIYGPSTSLLLGAAVKGRPC